MASLSSVAVGNGISIKSNYPLNSTSGMIGRPHFLSSRRERYAWTAFAEKNNLSVAVKVKKKKKIPRPWPDNPDPNVKGGVLFHLSHFKPFTEKPKPMALNFETPLLALEKKIEEMKKAVIESKLDLADVIEELEEKYQEALRKTYSYMTPIQRVHIARHPQRPTFLDHVFSITEKFVELHGDRAGYDDPAIVTGLGVIDGRRYMFIGHQKGRNTKENIMRNFAMPTPHGYRKALRMMKYADHHGFPILTFIDTPGAFADLKCEHLGQGEAIANNLRTMFGLKVPIVCIVIGEGGSGGALAIGCGNKLLMLENAVFYVASPEACATILWKDSKCAPEAARKLRITSHELCNLQIADGIIPEPLGGAHKDPEWTSLQIKNAINLSMEELLPMSTEELLEHRSMKFRRIGGYHEDIPIGPEKKFSMKPADIKVEKTPVLELESQKEKLLEEMNSSIEPSLDDLIEKLRIEVNAELSDAFETLRFGERVSSIEDEILEAKANKKPVAESLMDKIEELKRKMKEEFKSLPQSETTNAKLEMLNELMSVKRVFEKERIARAIMQSYGLEDEMYEMVMRAEPSSPFGALRGELIALMDETQSRIYELMDTREYADMTLQIKSGLLTAGTWSYHKFAQMEQDLTKWIVDGLQTTKLPQNFHAIVAKISHFAPYVQYDESFDAAHSP